MEEGGGVVQGTKASGLGPRPLGYLLAGAVLVFAAASGPAAADTLRDALTGTYATSPVLNAQREALKGTDATVALAGAQARPQIAATVGINRDLTRSGVLVTSRASGPVLSGGLDLNLPLFAGGRIRNSVGAAKARVEAERAALRAVEGEVFAEAVEAYMDVMRDRAVEDLNENQVRVLSENLRATTSLFNAGDLTRTDIAQSQARLSSATAQLSLAQARLTASEENYLRVVGRRPDTLAPPPPLPPLPATANEAARMAIARNPRLTAALQQARAAGLDVRVAFADRLPSVAGVLGGDYVNYLSDSFGVGVPRTGVQTTLGVTTRIPLYQGGAPSARIRQARAAEGELMERTVATERTVVANARSAFVTYQASLKAIQSNQDAVTANELALRGTRAERSVGSRTVIEVLNAEQELLASRVQLIAARRDAYVAGFQLLQAMGQASSEDLGLQQGPLYDPISNYRRVAGGWSDWASGEKHQPRSTSTLALAEAAPNRLADAPRLAANTPSPVATPSTSPPAAEKVAAVPKRPSVEPVASRAAASSKAAASGSWVIQLGAFRQKGAPQALFARLASVIGPKEPIYEPAGVFTRLLVGPYQTQAEARSACGKLGASTPCYPLKRP
jgi:outer membrane protein